MEWYIVRAQANRERKVSERILKEADKGELNGVIGRVIVPLEKVFGTKEGKKVQRESLLRHQQSENSSKLSKRLMGQQDF
jgi:transcription antitermination factor NusG